VATSAIARLALPAPDGLDFALAASLRKGGAKATGVFRITPPALAAVAVDAGAAARAFLTQSIAVVADGGLRARPSAEEWVRNATLFGELQLLGAF
jgi:hypothetical protein